MSSPPPLPAEVTAIEMQPRAWTLVYNACVMPFGIERRNNAKMPALNRAYTFGATLARFWTFG
jgi:hypothetical protein